MVADRQPGSNGGASSPASTTRRFDRTPPQHLEAEQAVLGAALLSRGALAEVVEIVRPEDFYRTSHELIFEAILELFASGETIDPITLVDQLTRGGKLDAVGGASAIHDLVATVPTAANAVYYARIVKEKAILRRLIEAGTEVVQLGYQGTEDVHVTVDRAEQMIYDVAQGRVGSEYSPLKELLSEGFERIEQRFENRSEVTGLPTGFNDLDRLTAGLQKQNLIILAGRPSMGKSSLALGIGQYVTVNLERPTIIFSLEMSKSEIVDRILSSEARIDSSKIRTGRLDDADWASLSDAMGRLAEAPLYIDDTASITLMEIRSKCRRLKQREGLDLVIIDYLQLMESHKRTENRQTEVSEISRGCKMLAKELDVPVMALSQLSRQPETRTDKRPQLADLRESGCLTRGTRLFRADTGAPVTFGELIDADLRDVPVWSRDDRDRLVPARLTHAFPSGVKPVLRVTLRSGATVEATANHPFLTVEGWTPLGELDVGSRVATARRLPEPSDPVPMDPDEIVLLAHLIGEGTTCARQPVHYTSADEENLQAVEKAAFTRFGITARREPDGRSAATTQLHLPAPHHLTWNRRNPIAEWLDGLGLWDHRSHERFLPREVFQLPHDQLRLFLHHLGSTDGSLRVRGEGRKGTRTTSYHGASSPRLAQDVRLLLLRLGIVARIEEVHHSSRPNARIDYRVRLYDTEHKRRFPTEVGVNGERGLAHTELRRAVRPRPRRSALSRSCPSREGLSRPADVLDDPHLERLATSDLFWDEIEEIEHLGEQEVFDATVDGTHNFVAEGVVLHNSLEQDSDLVTFIYRDEVYDPESPDRGVAELIIAKHRNGPTGVVKLAFLDHLTKFANLARAGV